MDYTFYRPTSKTVVTATVILLLATWIYSPWIHYGRYKSTRPRVERGWFFVFDSDHGEYSNVIMRVDFGRLVLIDGIILGAGCLAAAAIKPRQPKD